MMKTGDRGRGTGGGVLPLAALAVLGCTLAAADAELPARIQGAIDASAVARGAFWGIRVVNLETGATVFELNPDRCFVPASNTKLFTTALALMRLGPGHRFETTVLADREPDERGAVGSLRLMGGGDPNLSARAVPYRPGPITGNPLAAVEDLARQIAARGVRRVSGDIVGDDTAYIWAPVLDGWSADDPVWEYGAPPSALTVNDNAFSLSIRPGARVGDSARLVLTPALEYYQIDNRVRTVAGAGRRISFDREPGSRQLRVWGSLALGGPGQTVLLGVDDPALYAARALYEALGKLGVSIDGGCRARHLFPNQVEDLVNGPVPLPEPGVELARRASEPLGEDLRITAKVSQNLHAELLLRAVARARRGIGSREAGLEEMKAFLEETGARPSSYKFEDGSGLARLNLVTPAALVGLLRYMWDSPRREDWIGLLPVGGQDGTLADRFVGTPVAGRIRAKTGTLSHVSALSGYAETRRGGHLAFAILVNNYNGGTAEVRGVIDRICSLLVE